MACSSAPANVIVRRDPRLYTESEDHAADGLRYACMSRPFVWVPECRTRSVPDSPMGF